MLVYLIPAAYLGLLLGLRAISYGHIAARMTSKAIPAQDIKASKIPVAMGMPGRSSP